MDFSVSFINYFIIIAQVGIPTYAVRECAKIRDDKERLTKTFQEILLINIFTMILSYNLFLVLLLNVKQLQNYRTIMLIESLNIISTIIGVEWFFQAVEEYKYITIRNIIVKLFSLIAMFIFVKNENDFIIFAFISVLSNLISYFYNFIYVHKFIYIFRRFNNYDFKRHLKPILLLFAMNLSVSIYVSLDKVMLGFLAGDTYVGLYAVANKIVKVILTLVTSLSVVLLPRMSYYIENNEKTLISNLIYKSFNFVLMISIPATIGIFTLAEPIILLFAGPKYSLAISTIRIIVPIIIIIGLSNLIGIQILIPYGKEKITLVSTIAGAVVNFSLNLLLIPSLHHNGAAIATIIAETIVTIIQLYFAYPYIKGKIMLRNVISYISGGIIIVLLCKLVKCLIDDIIAYTFLSIILSVITYFSFLFIVKNELINEIIMKMQNLLDRKAKLKRGRI